MGTEQINFWNVVISIVMAIATIFGLWLTLKQDRAKKEQASSEWRTNMEKYLDKLRTDVGTLTKSIDKLQKSIDTTDENVNEHNEKLIKTERDIEMIEEVKENIKIILRSITDLGLIIAKHSEKLDRIEKDIDNLYRKKGNQ